MSRRPVTSAGRAYDGSRSAGKLLACSSFQYLCKYRGLTPGTPWGLGHVLLSWGTPSPKVESTFRGDGFLPYRPSGRQLSTQPSLFLQLLIPREKRKKDKRPFIPRGHLGL